MKPTIILAIILTGCAAPETRHSVIDGIPVTEYINQDSPCGTRRGTDGCSLGNAIWYASTAPAYVRPHEIAHVVKKMRHGPWVFDGRRKENCAVVTNAAPGYPLGALICNNGRRELVLSGE